MPRFQRSPDPLDRLSDELTADDVSLHFVVEGATGKVVAELRDPSGAVLERMSPSAALLAA